MFENYRIFETEVAGHLEQAAAAVMVLLMRLEMLSQVGDALCQDCDLNLGRTGVALMLSIILDNFLFFFLSVFSSYLDAWTHGRRAPRYLLKDTRLP